MALDFFLALLYSTVLPDNHIILEDSALNRDGTKLCLINMWLHLTASFVFTLHMARLHYLTKIVSNLPLATFWGPVCSRVAYKQQKYALTMRPFAARVTISRRIFIERDNYP